MKFEKTYDESQSQRERKKERKNKRKKDTAPQKEKLKGGGEIVKLNRIQ